MPKYDPTTLLGRYQKSKLKEQRTIARFRQRMKPMSPVEMGEFMGKVEAQMKKKNGKKKNGR